MTATICRNGLVGEDASGLKSGEWWVYRTSLALPLDWSILS